MLKKKRCLCLHLWRSSQYPLIWLIHWEYLSNSLFSNVQNHAIRRVRLQEACPFCLPAAAGTELAGTIHSLIKRNSKISIQLTLIVQNSPLLHLKDGGPFFSTTVAYLSFNMAIDKAWVANYKLFLTHLPNLTRVPNNSHLFKILFLISPHH